MKASLNRLKSGCQVLRKTLNSPIFRRKKAGNLTCLLLLNYFLAKEDMYALRNIINYQTHDLLDNQCLAYSTFFDINRTLLYIKKFQIAFL